MKNFIHEIKSSKATTCKQDEKNNSCLKKKKSSTNNSVNIRKKNTVEEYMLVKKPFRKEKKRKIASPYCKHYPKRGNRSLKKLEERLEHLKDFICSLQIMDVRPSLRNDGMSTKDSPPKKNTSSNMEGSASEGVQTKDEGTIKIRLRKNRRNTLYRNRVVVSRTPMLETIIEETETDVEEANDNE